MSTLQYLIIIEPTKTGYSAYSPDLPGCITVGKTAEQTRVHMQEDIELYKAELVEMGENIPKPGKLKEQIYNIDPLQNETFIAFVPYHFETHAKSA
jgi:predicted RNase H-like HicB family nuclease